MAYAKTHLRTIFAAIALLFIIPAHLAKADKVTDIFNTHEDEETGLIFFQSENAVTWIARALS